MNVIETAIAGVVIIEPRIFTDGRGYFFESFSQQEFEEKVGKVNFVQDNESKSRYGVIRGLHFQRPPYEQAKLVRVVKGKVLDVNVDIRKGSPTFGKYVAVELSEEVIFQYKCDNYYAPGYEGGIRVDDPELGIDWQIPEQERILSDKDKKHPLIADL